MHSLLTRLLNKRGIRDPQELSEEERKTFDQWRMVLSKDELSVSDIREFCSYQIGLIEMKWRDNSIENSKKAELIPYHTVYKMILTAIDGPKIAREQVENQLNQLINT